MIRPGDRPEAARIASALSNLRTLGDSLEGITDDADCETLVAQIIESQRRNRYFEYLTSADLSRNPIDPGSSSFDPLRAAVIFERDGQLDEAFWMVFFYTHFGKNRYSGYGYARDIYGRLGGERWTWLNVSDDVDTFRQWLFDHQDLIRSRNRPGGFGNHRKYESLDGWSYAGTGSVVESYVHWVGACGHANRIDQLTSVIPIAKRFDTVFQSLDEVHRFGRTGRFDYLMTASKLGLIALRPAHAHLTGATGPARGVRLLATGTIDGKLTHAEMNGVLAKIEDSLGVGYDVLEDALCNWQKSPSVFMPFRG